MTVTDRDIAVVGGVNTDYFALADELPAPGQTRNGEAFLQTLGGKAANQAAAAAALGARVALIAAIGDDERGRHVLARLREKVEVSGICAVGEAATGATLIHLDNNGQTQIVAALGANRLLTAQHVTAALGRLHGVRVVVAQLEVPVECAAPAFAWARGIGARTLLDPSPATPLQPSLLAQVDILRANAGEAETLTGVRVSNRATASDAAHRLRERGIPVVIVAASDHGTLVSSRDSERWLPEIAVEAIDPTGAGDAFVGALAALLARGESLDTASTLANAAAALATTVIGAQTAALSEHALRQLANFEL